MWISLRSPGVTYKRQYLNLCPKCKVHCYRDSYIGLICQQRERYLKEELQDGTLWYKKSKKSQICTNSVIYLNSLLSGSQVAFYKRMVFIRNVGLQLFQK